MMLPVAPATDSIASTKGTPAADIVSRVRENRAMADFVVMDENFFEVPRDRIVDNKVILTVVGDEIIYQDSEWAPEISER